MPTATMANVDKQLMQTTNVPAPKENRRAGLENPVQKMQREQREARELVESQKQAAEAKKAADRQAEAMRTKINEGKAPAAEAPSVAAVAPAKEEKKGLFSRAGGWFKGLFSPSVEDRSVAHAQAEAQKNPLVAQQMQAMEDAAPMSKAAFKKAMAEGAVAAKAEAKRKADQVNTEAKKALEEISVGEYNRAFGKEKAQVAAPTPAEAAARLAEEKAAKAELAIAMAKKAPETRSDLSKQAEKLIKKGDAEFMEHIADGRSPEYAAAAVAFRKQVESAVRQEKAKAVVRGAVDLGVNLASKTAKGAVEGVARVGKAVMEAKSAQADKLVKQNARPWETNENVDAVIPASQISAEQDALNAREKSAKAKKEKPGYVSTALSGFAKAGQYVRERRGPTVSEAANALANADLHGAGMKAVDAGINVASKVAKGVAEGASFVRAQTKRGPTPLEALDKTLGWTEKQLVGTGGIVERTVEPTVALYDRAEKAATEFLAKDWEATKQRMAARLEKMKSKPAEKKPWETMEEPAWVSELRKGDEDTPDEIADVVAETAAERKAGPENFAEVFDDLKRMEDSNNRSKMHAFSVEATNLEDIALNGQDPSEHLDQIGEKFRGWKNADVKRLVKRLYDTGLLAK